MRIKTKILALVAGLSLVPISIAGIAITTLNTYHDAVDEIRVAGIRAVYGERLNRLVSNTVMESRGIYAAKDAEDARKFSDGVVASLRDIDTLLKEWAPVVPSGERALFDALARDAAAFKAFRTETARLGTEASPQAASLQGNNEANRANRKAFQASIDALAKRGSDEAEAIDRGTEAIYGNRLILLLSVAAGGTLLAVLLATWWASRQITRPLHGATEAVGKLAAGEQAELPGLASSDEIGDLSRAMKAIYDRGVQVARIKAALDSCSTCVMVTDADEHIVYMNESFRRLLGGLREAFQAYDREFAVEAMTGRHIDYYRKNPALKREVLSDTGHTRRVNYTVGDRVFHVAMDPIRGKEGEILGHILEWRELVDELAAMRQVGEVVEAAGAGDFSQRVPTAGKSGFQLAMAQGVNRISELVEGATGEFAGALGTLAQGDLTCRITTAYEGRFAELKGSLNETLTRLGQTVATIQTTSREVSVSAAEISAGAGDLASTLR